MKNKKITLFCAAGVITLFLNGCVQTKPQSQPPYIGAERAKNTALQEASASPEAAADLSADLKTKNGQDYYEVIFDYNERHYIYQIDPLTGNIASRDVSDLSLAPASSESPAESEPAAVPDIQPGERESSQETAQTAAPQEAAVPQAIPQSSSQGNEPMGEEKAKSIALAHAGLEAGQVSFVKVKQDWEDGRLVYEVEFYSNNGAMEYDYEIDAYSGAIVSYDYDAESNIPPAAHGTAGAVIGEDKAKSIALAKVPGAAASHIYQFETDYDDGRMEYEGEIRYNGMEYEFEIDAATGTILSWKAEPY